MLSLGPLAFLSPWVLLGLAALPVIWWLVRITPPAPREAWFPALRLYLGLKEEERSSARTPWWLLLLRLVIAALVILGLAAPVLNPVARLGGEGPLVVLIDDGWTAAQDWEARRAMAEARIAEAAETGRTVHLLGTAPRETPLPAGPQTVAEARARLAALEPQPLLPDRAAAAARLTEVLEGGPRADIVWLSDGLDHGQARAAASALSQLGRVTLVAPGSGETAPALAPGAPEEASAAATQVRAVRAGGGAETLTVHAVAQSGPDATPRIAASAPAAFADGASEAVAAFELPLALRNEIVRFEIAGLATTGARLLLDDRWQRRTVGIVSGRAIEAAQPLLSDLYYLEKALEPVARVTRGDLDALLAATSAPDMIVLADVGRLVPSEVEALEDWIARGGVLVRFAGPRLAAAEAGQIAAGNDALLPVRLRGGGRALGGALTWERAQELQPFDDTSPFAGLEVPGDVSVSRQVLAEPAPDLPQKTWARLADGTPLVTGEARGQGHLVLVHVTANTQWSALPLSGLYPAMLKRLVDIAPGVTAAADGPATSPAASGTATPAAAEARRFRLATALDGRGGLSPVDGAPASVPVTAFAEPPSLAAPPGLYAAEGGGATRAMNALAPGAALTPLPSVIEVYQRTPYATGAERALGPWLLAAALVLALVDTLLGMILRGLHPGARRPAPRGAAALALAAALGASSAFAPVPPASAQQADDVTALAAALDVRLAYVRTGDPEVDELTEAGLAALTRILAARTSVEGEDPVAVDPESDPLVFYPLIYWPVLPAQGPLSDAALKRLDDYMRTGGMVLFDTRDAQIAPIYSLGQGATPATQALRQLLGGLDLPPLEPVPDDHVLTKAFYLLQEFPGRYTGSQVWVAAQENRGEVEDAGSTGATNDGVSPIVIGGHDWAAAWATDRSGRPLAGVVPGGERQRELAYRFGVNLVMYALTGNYKADQVHVPALLERLGQ